MLKYLASRDGKLTLTLRRGSKVRDLVEALYFVNPDLYDRVWDRSSRRLRPDIVIFVDDVDIRLLDGLDTELRDGSRVTILAYIHGG